MWSDDVIGADRIINGTADRSDLEPVILRKAAVSPADSVEIRLEATGSGTITSDPPVRRR